MAITTLDQYIAAPSQRITYCKTASRTSVAVVPFSIFDQAGNPSAGTLAIGNTANGIVPTDATAGYPIIDSFGGTTGYLTGVQFGNTVASRITLFDCLFSAGAYAFNASTVLASQPSYAGRIPASGYKNTEIWFEAVTAFTGNPSIAVTYTTDGAAGLVIESVNVNALPLTDDDNNTYDVGKAIVVWVSGGTVGKSEKVILNYTTEAGRVLDEAIIFRLIQEY